jgi:hydroxymethylpyrimidine/phosphomethylpyrimidine kinase
MNMNDSKHNSLPIAMTIAGHDPTGGAGIQADIEAMISMGCHACSVVTAATIQDTAQVIGYSPLNPDLVIQQARAVLEDMPVHAIKIGMLPTQEIVEAVHSILIDYPRIPVILDPVMTSGGGNALIDHEVTDALLTLLLPQTTMVTPNSLEARRLAQDSDTLDACAMSILDHGCEYVLITGTHENTQKVHNTLYGNNRKLETYDWDRLNGNYHGSGCTLSSAIAALMAQGQEPMTATLEAQRFTWESLKQSYQLGMGQKLPNRLFWCSGLEDGKDDE